MRYSAFEAEIRRRLWWQLVVLDVRASEDRGSEQVMFSSTYNTLMPSNLNDDDFGPESQRPLPQRTGLTDLSFCLLTYDISSTLPRLAYIGPVNPEGGTQESLSRQDREDIIKECSQRVEQEFLAYCDLDIPLQWSMVMIGRLVLCEFWLLLQFPLHNQPSATRPIFSREQTLRTSVSILELSDLISKNPLVAEYDVSKHPVFVLNYE
jgi:hypothetical protein